jgi:hypothetical protein
MASSQHVVPKGDGWAVRRAGSARSSGVYKAENEAISAARGIARNQGTDVYIHGQNGRILSRETYAKTTPNTKG